jgi:hypothetical protein
VSFTFEYSFGEDHYCFDDGTIVSRHVYFHFILNSEFFLKLLVLHQIKSQIKRERSWLSFCQKVLTFLDFSSLVAIPI